MWSTLALIPPVLIPSWRFFKAIEPSPRVQWRFLGDADWRDFRPRPKHVTPWQMCRRLFWNPAWNDTLFVVTCAERIAEHPTPHSITEITSRIVAAVSADDAGRMAQFQLVFVQRSGNRLSQEVLFLSDPFATKA